MKAKPAIFYVAVHPDGTPRRAGGGCVPLYDEPDEARYGWGPGFAKPPVIEVELRVVQRKARRARGR